MQKQHEIIEEAGRLYIRDDAGIIARLDFSRAEDLALVVSSTYVDPGHRGKGLAKALLDALAVKARASGVRIVPLCPYVKHQFMTRDEYADVAVL